MAPKPPFADSRLGRFLFGSAGPANDRSMAAADLMSLSIFRILFALFLLGDYAINLTPYYADFYGEAGIAPMAMLAADPDIVVTKAIAWALETLRLGAMLPVLYPAALLAFALGYRTRLANAAVLLFFLYLYWRNYYLNSGAEALTRLLLIWCLFLPLNRYWSIDSALDPQPRERPCPRLPILAVRLQIVSLYIFSALFKLAGPAWLGGAAVGMALRDNMFGGTPAGLFVAATLPWLAAAATYATIAFQLAMPFMVYSPWRNDWLRAAALAGAALMHLSFIVFLNIGTFPYICLAMLALLAPDEWWRRLLRRRGERLGRVRIFYDPDCGFCHRVCL
ncbi:MAG: HTTM domain-containing protein, partial [Rhodospirillales bacterium]